MISLGWDCSIMKYNVIGYWMSLCSFLPLCVLVDVYVYLGMLLSDSLMANYICLVQVDPIEL